jgi:hypothetical protein
MTFQATSTTTINEEELMSTDICTPELKVQPRRLAAPDRSPFVPSAAVRFITAVETAALLEVTEELLFRWYATGQGLQPVPRPEGRLYRAEHVKRLAAMPRSQRMLAISRRRY